ncbi:hypothetical protein AVEN_98525-1 [Araneus ventricosus]|uniref:RNase H type-1 domain-containing protein n=1 Tax=Araneus ventricosus TaxID=182803 RepID=A0A4Y2W339_ARAVE|nr:hypothetical protein AVEN_98525-1 [Araneus ventricosus]
MRTKRASAGCRDREKVGTCYKISTLFVGWALENGYKINIFTDSLSYIQSHHTRSNFVVGIKKNISQASASVGLSWVKDHASISGNNPDSNFSFSKVAATSSANLQGCNKFDTARVQT